MKKIGFLTSGGDCQSLNATMRGVAKTLYQTYPDVEIYGILEGYKGLIYGNYRKMQPSDFSGILTEGGTIIGTSRQPFKKMREPDANGLDKVEAMKSNYKKWGFDCLVILGGNGTHKTANLLSEEGCNVVTLPKTIDNDIWGTDITFGFQSAVNIATNAIDCIHTTAASHSRVFIVEVMGHKVGWLTLHAGIAGGADIILLPEIPYDINSVVEALDKRTKEGKKFSILADDLPPEAVDYVKIISKKAVRLKNMVYDVFELAKTASGELVIAKASLSLNKLIVQTLTDMEDTVKKSGLDIKLKIPEKDVLIISDGSRIYRVMQNIIENALKYSLKGTRIYITESTENNTVKLTIKNTASYEMDFKEEEILERFVRGDKSRNTDGNGLGLSIAKEFTAACGGTFNIKIDGDQFNVIISFPIETDTIPEAESVSPENI